MKSFPNRIAIALVIVAMASVMVFAKTQKGTVTFVSNVNVNGTLLKKGTYDLRFNDETKELSILKNGKVVAKTTTRVEKEDAPSQSIKFSTRSNGDHTDLVSVTFGGSDEKIVVSGSESASK